MMSKHGTRMERTFTMKSRVRKLVVHIRTYRLFSWGDPELRNSSADRYPNLLILCIYTRKHSKSVLVPVSVTQTRLAARKLSQSKGRGARQTKKERTQQNRIILRLQPKTNAPHPLPPLLTPTPALQPLHLPHIPLL